MSLNETHRKDLTSWVTSANKHTDFPIQNLPFAIFRRVQSDENFRGGVAIGDYVLDMKAVSASQIIKGAAANAVSAASETTLNHLMSLGKLVQSEFRLQLSKALRAGSVHESVLREYLVPMSEVEYNLPCNIGDYTDFYSSIQHATAVGVLFRPDQPLLPNYKWVPIAYHGRSSSINISGQHITRPHGQIMSPGNHTPTFNPSKRLDYELELGIFVGQGNSQGQPISIEDAEDHIFGACLLNDWSARDIQSWEYQPLGPFLSKNFATTLSPWIITNEALAPFRTEFSRPAADPEPLEHLSCEENSASGAIDIQMLCFLQTQRMRDNNEAPVSINGDGCSFKNAYWTMAQMLTHHTSNGCNTNPGDLLGSGTQSGVSEDQAGSLLELTQGGKKPITLPNGETRTFIKDGDCIVLRGYCEHPDAVKIGFGEVSATISA